MEKFVLTTECYIRRGDEILFIHKGGNDLNTGKFLGIGGHLEKGESPMDGIVREIEEETGIKRDELSNLRMRAVITFINPVYGDEYIHLFEADYIGNVVNLADDAVNNEGKGTEYLENAADSPVRKDPALNACDEGELKWVLKKDVYSLPIWEGDKRMFDEMFKDDGFFTMKLVYDGDELKEVIVDQAAEKTGND
ncbi:MAG: NUDIX domain-containing protein [Lachnospiraceae bacterium]|nr:NUDIX domain-containing protein [Lachnospiraceae bacterium]